MDLQFDNAFVRELPADPELKNFRRAVHNSAYSLVTPTPVKAPKLLAFSREMATELGFTEEFIKSDKFANIFAGNELLDGMEPWAAVYGGHQFGNWAGQLGDGRAISLGELLTAEGKRWELQLKGAGPTPYSRTADGRAVLRSSVREFLCSEAMFHLGVPTTRALSLVDTGELVVRDMFYDGNPRPEPGAIVCRVAPSFVRFGNFEIFASRGDDELLKTFTDFVIRRDFSELLSEKNSKEMTPDIRAEFFEEVCLRTAKMVVEWMRVGFVHGVMNSDNMSILGLTIDYGPYGWVDNFDLDWTPNTTDSHGRRYRFGNQIPIAHWNLVRLANALTPVFEDTVALTQCLDLFVDEVSEQQLFMMGQKLGIDDLSENDEELLNTLFQLLSTEETDMTIFFRNLSDLDADNPDVQTISDAFYAAPSKEIHDGWKSWLQQYSSRLKQSDKPAAFRKEQMDGVNPRYVLRNYMAQLAIEKAEKGDPSVIMELLDVVRNPYTARSEFEHWFAKRPDWARTKPGCSMLSCSS